MLRRNRREHSHDIWPMFVDVLSTVLMVVIFALMTFMISQLYLSDTLNDRECEVRNLNSSLSVLQSELSKVEEDKKSAHAKIAVLEQLLLDLQQQLDQLRNLLGATDGDNAQMLGKVQDLLGQMQALREQIKSLSAALDTAERQLESKQRHLEDVQQDLSRTLAEKVAALRQLSDAYEGLRKEHEEHKAKYAGKQHFSRLRSEFFARLQDILGERQDIRVVGDRFVFQSEVLFDPASAELGKAGRKQLRGLAQAIKDIAAKIPGDIAWVLRVDGHTDNRPISTAAFPSNWELSAARAMAVVHYLISEGIEPRRLVAAGFGEYQPLSAAKEEQARNRRIEFKLDQR